MSDKTREQMDRELLEKVAQVTGGENGQHNGLFYQWHDLPHTGVDRVLRYVGQREWNPLTDDGDCARLEAACLIDFYWHADGLAVARLPGRVFEEWFADHGNDRNAARRRASVRAAAESRQGGETP